MSGGVESAWRLRDERELLQRSLEDADREHVAGDLADEDYALLRGRDERRLAEVEAAIAADAAGEVEAAIAADAAGEPGDLAPGGVDGASDGIDGADGAPDAAGREAPGSVRGGWRRRVRWHRRWWLAASGLVLVGAAIILLVVEMSSPRLPGQDASGSIDLNTAQQIERQLTQAKTLLAGGKDTQALELYSQVLAEDPKQPVALAEWGWLDWQAASKAKERKVAADGASALVLAVKLDPQLFAAQYYLGAVLLEEGDPAKAVAHFSQFLSDKPTGKWRRGAAPTIRAAYGALNEPVPAGVPGK